MDLNEQELKTLLIVIKRTISDNWLQVDVDNGLDENFKQHTKPLINRLLEHESTDSQAIAQIYQKLSIEYLKQITNES